MVFGCRWCIQSATTTSVPPTPMIGKGLSGTVGRRRQLKRDGLPVMLHAPKACDLGMWLGLPIAITLSDGPPAVALGPPL